MTVDQQVPTAIYVRRGRSARRKIVRHWQLYFIVLLPTVQLLIFKYMPMLGAQIAFKKYSPRKGIWGSQFIGWQNFARFFDSPSSMQIIINTIIISLYSIAATFPFAIMLAVALSEARGKKFKKTVQMVTYAPYFISTVVLVSMINQFLNPTIGIISLIFKRFSVELGNVVGMPSVFRHLYVWSGVWQNNGYNAIIYLAALTSINPELQEAAVVDGCSRVKRIWHVDLPCIRPTIVTLLILNVGQVMSVGFEKIFLMQNPAILSISEVISTYVYRVGLTGSTDPGYASAIGLFNSVVNVILILVANFAARRIDGTGLW